MAKTKSATGKVTKKEKNGAGVEALSKAGKPSKLAERVVPIPQIDTYSELPFALIDKSGEQPARTTSAVKSQQKPNSKVNAKPKAKTSPATKRAAKKTTKSPKARKAAKKS